MDARIVSRLACAGRRWQDRGQDEAGGATVWGKYPEGEKVNAIIRPKKGTGPFTVIAHAKGIIKNKSGRRKWGGNMPACSMINSRFEGEMGIGHRGPHGSPVFKSEKL